MEDNDRFVDELLNSAMAYHRDEEPRAGLEGRILAHVRATASQRPAGRKAWRLWAAAAATAAVLALVGIYAASHVHRSVSQASQAANTAPMPTESLKANLEPGPAASDTTKVVEPTRIARRERKPAHRVQAHHWPSQFPTPAPLTAEQKALVRYVQETPPDVLAASLFKEKSEDRPIEIKPLKIAPLEIQPLSAGPNKEELQ